MCVCATFIYFKHNRKKFPWHSLSSMHSAGHKHASFLILYILTLSTSKPRKLGVGYFE